MERLEQLAEILLRMPPVEQGRLIASLARENLDAPALEYLRLRVFSIEKILEDLDDESLKRLLRRLGKETSLALREEAGTENQARIDHLLPKASRSSEETPRGRELKEQVLAIVLEEMSQGRIAWNSPLLRLMPPPCRPPEDEAKSKGRVVFQILNPVLRPGEGIRLMIYAPGQKRVVNISMQTRGELFFSGRKWFRRVELDHNGFYFGEVFSRREEGPMTVWAEFPGSGQVRRTCVVASGAGAKFDLHVRDMRHEYDKLRLSFRLRGDSPRESEAAGVLWCLRCGAPAGTGTARLSANQGEFEFSLPPTDPPHRGDLFLHVHIGEHVLGQVINPFASEVDQTLAPVPVREIRDRRPGEAIRFEPPGLRLNERLFYHATSSLAAADAARRAILSGTLELTGRSRTAVPRRESPLEGSVLSGDVLLLGPRRAPLRVATLMYRGREMSYAPRDAENVAPVYLDVYRLSGGVLEPTARIISHPAREALVWAQAPAYLETDEHVELPIYYRGPGGGTLEIVNGRRESLQVGAAGIAHATLRGEETMRITLKCANSSGSIELRSSPRPRKFKRLEYLPAGARLDPGEGAIHIFASARELSDYIVERHIIDYPWGCAEQTAARLSGIGLLIVARGVTDRNHPLVMHFADGLRALRSYRDEWGAFRQFHSGEASPGVGEFIARNLAILVPHRDKLEPLEPLLFEMLDGLNARAPETGSTGEPGRELGNRMQTLLHDTYGFGGELPDPACRLREDRGQLNCEFDGWRSRGAYCAELAARMIHAGENDIEVFARKEKEPVPVPGGGLRGFLERIGLLSPRNTFRSICVGRPLKDALPVLLKHCRFDYLEAGAPSTQESIALHRLVYALPLRAFRYRKREGDSFSPDKGGPVTEILETASPHCWVLRDVPVKSREDVRQPRLEIDKRDVHRGELIRLRIHAGGVHHEVFHLLLPPILEPTEDTTLLTERQLVSVHSGVAHGEIHLRAIHPGRGRIRIVGEFMYDPSRSYVFDAGIINVSGAKASAGQSPGANRL